MEFNIGGSWLFSNHIVSKSLPYSKSHANRSAQIFELGGRMHTFCKHFLIEETPVSLKAHVGEELV